MRTCLSAWCEARPASKKCRTPTSRRCSIGTSCGSSRAVTVQWTCLPQKPSATSLNWPVWLTPSISLRNSAWIRRPCWHGTSPRNWPWRPACSPCGTPPSRSRPRSRWAKVVFGSSAAGKFHNTSVSGPVWCLPHVSQAPRPPSSMHETTVQMPTVASTVVSSSKCSTWAMPSSRSIPVSEGPTPPSTSPVPPQRRRSASQRIGWPTTARTAWSSSRQTT